MRIRWFFASDVIGESAKKAVDGLKPGNIVLLENLRFHKEEEKKNDPALQRRWPIMQTYM